MLRSSVALLIVLAIATLLFPQVSTAGTPISSPAVAHCLAPIRSYDDLRATLATPVASPSTTVGSTTIPAGTPADQATINRITETVEELVACFNAGEVLRAYSLYTPDYLRNIFSNQDPLSRADYEMRATPHPLNTDEYAVVREIRGARLFADRSVGAYVTIEYPLIPVPKTFFFTFVIVDGTWLIDGALGEISFSVP